MKKLAIVINFSITYPPTHPPTKHTILNPAANGAWFIVSNYYVQYVQSAAFWQPVVMKFKPHHDCAYQALPWNSRTDAEGVK